MSEIGQQPRCYHVVHVKVCYSIAAKTASITVQSQEKTVALAEDSIDVTSQSVSDSLR